MVVLVTCKNEEDPFKNEGTRVVTCKSIQLLKGYRIKFQIFAAHAHKDALINETFIQT